MVVAGGAMETKVSIDEGGSGEGGSDCEQQNLQSLEDRLLGLRRDQAKVDRTLPRVGLALSGGGIRSATYCLGLLRGLARNNILPRVDHLSTVSGGSYVGAMYARLVHSIGLERAITTLATRNSLALQWLRRNGRYLTPAGARDRGLAMATYFRAWVGVQIEMAFLAVLLGLLVVLPHLLHQSLAPEGLAEQLGELSALWMLAAVFWLLGAPGAMAAYWSAHDPTEGNVSRSRTSALRLACASVLAGIFLLWLSDAIGTVLPGWARASGPTSPWVAALCAGLSLVLMACGAQMLASLRALGSGEVSPAAMRGRLTARLRMVMLGTLILLALGLLDMLSWRLASWLAYRDEWFGISLFWAVAASAAIGVLRAVAEPLQKLAGKSKSSATWRRRLLDLIGVTLALVLAMFWLTLVQWWVFFEPNEFELIALRGLPGGDVQRWLLAFSLILGWVLLTARNHSMVNASSLYPLYRARLTRAWISVGNALRFQPLPQPPAPGTGGPDSAPAKQASSEAEAGFEPWKEAKPFELDRVHAVTEVMASDDLALQKCRPEARGGPLHHINVCLNQTKDDHSGMYSADRKGNLLTVNAHGLCFSRIEDYYPWPNGEGVKPESGTLGHWTAISGAAAAPGAGSHTSTGWAMSLFLLGMRLGYWMRRPDGVVESSGRLQTSTGQSLSARLAHMFERRCPKPLLLLREFTASFRGLTSPWWFLSDGGHFENMGIYALLRRRLDFIIAADCGADPDFRFADLDNLIRKARVDLDVEIELYDSDAINSVLSSHSQRARVLTPEVMAKHASERGVLLARVRYPGGAEGPRYGTLLILKPRIHAHLDLDVMSYAQTHAAFPQQPTSDQFFDEAQWESYQRLGEDLALALTPAWFAQLPGWSAPVDAKVAMLATSNAFATSSQERTAAAIELRRAATTTASAAAVGTGLGLGAFTTILLALWPTVDEVRKSAEREHEARTALMEGLENYLDSATPLEEGASLPMAQQARVERFLSIDAGGLDAWSRVRHQRLQERLVRHCALIDKPSHSRPASPLCGVSPFNLWSDVAASYWQVSCERRMRRSSFEQCEKMQAASASSGPAGVAQPEPAPHDWLGDSAQYLDPQRLRLGLQALPFNLTEDGAQGRGPRPADFRPGQGDSPLGPGALAQPADSGGPSDALSRCVLQDRLIVYTQVYTAPDAARFERWRASQQPEGATIGGSLRFMQVEDVFASAERKGRKPPFQWGVAVALVHQPEHIECVRELLSAQLPQLFPSSAPDRVRALPAGLRPTPRVVELWIPPDQTSALGAADES